MGKAIGALLVGLFLLWCVSVAFKGMGPSPQIVAQDLLGDTSALQDFDGFVRKGDGYEVQIRFRAQADWVNALPYKGFKESDCAGVRNIISFSVMRLAAWPLWTPETLADAKCYRRLGANKWSPTGRDVLLAEPEGGWIYFAGEGREYDKAMPGYGVVPDR